MSQPRFHLSKLYMSTLIKACWPTFSFSPFFRPFICSFLHHHHDHCSVSHNSHYHYALSYFCIYHAPPNHHQTALHQPQDHHSRTSHHHSIQGPHNHSLAEEQTGGPRQQAMRLPALPSRWNLRGGGQWLHLHLSCRKRRSCVRERWGELQKSALQGQLGEIIARSHFNDHIINRKKNLCIIKQKFFFLTI